MKIRWFVIDGAENLTSWSAKTDKAEDFGNRTAALKRAAHLAKSEPHKAFYVCQTTDLVVVETKPVNRTILVKS